MSGTSSWMWRGPAVPVVLALVALAVVLASGSRGDGQAEPDAEGARPTELWRCHACASIPGKAWVPCRTVTGRGNEKGARDRVVEVVCGEAGLEPGRCEITRIDCRQLDGADGGPGASE